MEVMVVKVEVPIVTVPDVSTVMIRGVAVRLNGVSDLIT